MASTVNVTIETISVNGTSYKAIKIPATNEDGSVTVEAILKAAYGAGVVKPAEWKSKLKLHNDAANADPNDKVRPIQEKKGVDNCGKALEDARIYAGAYFILGDANAPISGAKNSQITIFRAPNARVCEPIVSLKTRGDEGPPSVPFDPVSDFQADAPQPKTVDVALNPRVALVQFPSEGTVDQKQNPHHLASLLMIADPTPPPPPVTAARGAFATTRDQSVGARAATLAGTAALIGAPAALAAKAGVLAIIPQLGLPDDIQHVQHPGQGGNQSTVPAPKEIPFLDTSNAWLANGRLNPFGVGEQERRDATRLDLIGTHVVGGTISDLTTSGFRTAHLLPVGAKTGALSSQRQEKDGVPNDSIFGTATETKPLRGLNNYDMAAWLNENILAPRINKAVEAFNAELGKGETERNKGVLQQKMQDIVSLSNAQMNLTGISNYDVHADFSQITTKHFTDEQLALLNPRERIAYNKAMIVDSAKNLGLELDSNAQPQLHGLTKKELVDKYTTHYAEMITGRPAKDGAPAYKEQKAAFIGLWESPKPDGFGRAFDPKTDGDLSTEAGRTKAAKAFVEHTPFVKSYPEEGIPLDQYLAFASKPDHAFHAYEKGAFAPSTKVAKSTQALAGAMTALSSKPDAVKAVLEGARTNPELGNGIAHMYQEMAHFPRDLRGTTPTKLGDHALPYLKARGIPEDFQLSTMGFTKDGKELYTHGMLRTPEGKTLSDLHGVIADNTKPDQLTAIAEDFRLAGTGALKKGGLFNWNEALPNHGPGHLAQPILASLAKQPELLEKLKTTLPQEDFQNLLAGVRASVDMEHQTTLRVDYTRLTTATRDADIALRAARQGQVPETTPLTGTVIKQEDAPEQASKVYAHLRGTNKAVGELLTATAQHGSPAAQKAVMADIAQSTALSDAEAITLASAAVKGQNPQALRIAVLTNSGQDSLISDIEARGKLAQKLGGKNSLTALEARTVLQAISKEAPLSQTALTSIGSDAAATKALVTPPPAPGTSAPARALSDSTLGTALASLSEEGKTALSGATKVPATILAAPATQDVPTTYALPADTKAVFDKKAALTTPQARIADALSAEDSSRRNTTLTALIHHPRTKPYMEMTAVRSVQTLGDADHTALMEKLRAGQRTTWQKLTGTPATTSEQLADLFEAMHNPTASADQRTATWGQITNLMAKNPGLASTVLTHLQNSAAGQAALSSTVLVDVTAASTAAAGSTPTDAVGGQQGLTPALISAIAVQATPADMAAAASAAAAGLSNATVAPEWQMPPVLIPIGTPSPQSPPGVNPPPPRPR